MKKKSQEVPPGDTARTANVMTENELLKPSSAVKKGKKKPTPKKKRSKKKLSSIHITNEMSTPEVA